MGERAGGRRGGSAVTGACRGRMGTRSEAGAPRRGLPMIASSRAASCWNDMSAASMLCGDGGGVPDVGGTVAVRVQGRESVVGRTDGGEWHRAARFTGLGT